MPEKTNLIISYLASDDGRVGLVFSCEGKKTLYLLQLQDALAHAASVSMAVTKVTAMKEDAREALNDIAGLMKGR